MGVDRMNRQVEGLIVARMDEEWLDRCREKILDICEKREEQKWEDSLR